MPLPAAPIATTKPNPTTPAAKPTPAAAAATTAPGAEGGDAVPVDAQAAAAAAKQAMENVARRFKVKIDGSEAEVDEQELLRGYSHNTAASKRMREAHQREESLLAREAELDSLLQAAKTDPDRVFEALGIDPDEYAKSRAVRTIKRSEMSPEQIELEQARAALRKEKAEIDAAKQKNAQEGQQKVMKEYQEEMTRELPAVFKDLGLPVTEHTIALVATRMLAAARRGVDLPLSKAASYVKYEFETQIQQTLGQMTAEQAVRWLPKNVLDQIRQHRVQSATARAPAGTPARKPETAPKGVQLAEGRQQERPTVYRSLSEARRAGNTG